MTALTLDLKPLFAPLCPDFVAELRSGDDLEMLRAKLQEYLANGARLGWLIDPGAQRVEVYRQGAAPQILANPTAISGDPVLPGFVLDLSRIL